MTTSESGTIAKREAPEMLRRTPHHSFARDVSHEDLELRGTKVRAFQIVGGTRDPARALVCIAGMGANGRSFTRQAALARDRFLLLLNTPIETPRGKNPIEFAAEAIEEYLDHESLEHPVLIGSSFGGAVAALVALRRPEKIAGLVLVSAVLARRQIPLAFPGFVNFLQAPEPIARLVAPIAAQIMGGLALDRDARDELVREARHFTGAELKVRLQALLGLDLFPLLPRLALPTLFIHGSRDLFVPWRRGRRAAALVPGSQFLLIRGAGHLPYMSHAGLFNESVRAFLQQRIEPLRGA